MLRASLYSGKVYQPREQRLRCVCVCVRLVDARCFVFFPHMLVCFGNGARTRTRVCACVWMLGLLLLSACFIRPRHRCVIFWQRWAISTFLAADVTHTHTHTHTASQLLLLPCAAQQYKTQLETRPCINRVKGRPASPPFPNSELHKPGQIRPDCRPPGRRLRSAPASLCFHPAYSHQYSFVLSLPVSCSHSHPL